MSQVLIVEALRSPLSDRRGPPAAPPDDERAALVLRGLVHRSGLDPRELDGLFLGAPVASLARLAAAAAGLPLDLATHTVQAGHASGLAAVQLGAFAVLAGARGPMLAAGVSGPVGAPEPGPSAWWRARWGPHEEARARLACLIGVQAEEVEAFQARPGAGEGDLREVVDRDGDFRDAPPGVDRLAAAGLLLSGEEGARRLRLRVRARIAAVAAAACDPAIAPLAVVPAAQRALEEAGLRPDQVDLVELDASDPVSAVAALRGLGIDAARACSTGFPAAAVPGLAGLPRLCRLVHALPARRARFGLCAVADGLGQAWAVVVDAQTYG